MTACSPCMILRNLQADNITARNMPKNMAFNYLI